MATINTTDDPNRTLNTANAAPQQGPATSGVQTSSGNFSTLQKYLGANQGAGQRLAGMIGGNLNKEAGQLQDTSQREQSESGLANQNISNLTNDTNKFTQDLSGQAQGTSGLQSGKAGYDVSSYATNLAGQQAANQIAANQDTLNKFTGIRAGDTSAKLKTESDKQADESVLSANKQYDTNQQRQQQLRLNNGRDTLLQEALNTQNQRSGLRNLDNAFLTQDKSKTLNSISNNLRSNVQGIQQNQGNANESKNQITDLVGTQSASEKGLNSRVSGLQSEYDQSLQDRVGAVNQGKQSRMQQYLDEYAKLKAGEVVKEGFAKDLGLDQVKVADPNRMSMSSNGNVDTNMGMAKPYEGVRLFNSIKDNPELRAVLDTSLLERQAQHGSDVVNQQDIGNLNSIAALSGAKNNLNKLSDFTGRQIGPSTLQDILNTRADRFQNEDLVKNFTGTGQKREDVMRSGLFGKNKVGEAVANSSATGNINDILNNRIYRQTSAGENRDDSVLGRIVNNPLQAINPLTGVLSPIPVIKDVLGGPKGMESQSAQNFRDSKNMDAINSGLANREEQLKNAGYSASGLSGDYHGGGGEQERTSTNAEAQSVARVNEQGQQFLNNIGYKNLLRLSQGDF